MKNIIAGFFLMILITGCTMKEQADLIIINAKVYTADSTFSTCSAIAVKQGLILATGEDDQILNRYMAPVVKDMKGAPLYPGFNDAHCHLFGLGVSLNRVDLRGAESFEEILQRFKNPLRQSQTQISGRRWLGSEPLGEQGVPGNEKLNELFPDIPVVLSRIDFHAVIVNNAAINALGITPGDPSLPKGEALMNGSRFKESFWRIPPTGLKKYCLSPTRRSQGIY